VTARATGRSSAQARNKPRRAGKIIGWTLIASGVVVVAASGWLAYTGLQARDSLQSAATALSGAQTALLGGDIDAAEQDISQAGQLTADAQNLTSDPVWKVAGAVPLLGNTPRSVTLATSAADDVINGALPDFVQAARVLDFNTLKSSDGTVDLTRFRPTAAELRQAQDTLISAQGKMAEIPTSGVPGFVSTGTAELSQQVDEALGISTIAADILDVLPGVLGEAGPQQYFVAFQSPVEIRGTGGFLGSYGQLTVSQGDLINREVIPNNDLQNFPAPVLDLGPDYARLYGPDVRLWVNMNLSPNFPYAARQWAEANRLQFGQAPAGVLAVDLTAMQYLLQATGPVTAPDGKQITAENVLQYLGNDIYFEFAGDNDAREEYQGEIAVELIDRILRLDSGLRSLIPALTDAVAGGHLQLWSADPAVQQLLVETPLAGETPIEPGPYAQLVLNNGAGNKMDFYTQRKLTYTSGACEDGYRRSAVVATITNAVPTTGELPRYITVRNDDTGGQVEDRANRSLFYVHLPLGAAVTATRLNGEPAQWQLGQELGRPVVFGTVELPPGTPVTLEVEVLEPVSDNLPVVPIQPMVKPQETTINWGSC
jgi:hypothetical protein